MGREAVTVASWKGEIAEVKALLESTEIILRGHIRARILRTDISAFAVDDDALTVTVAGDILRLELGHADAAKWAAILAKPLPTLAEKLGIDATRRAFVIGQVDDDALSAALVGAVTSNVEDASVIIAMLNNEDDLNSAIAFASRGTPRPIWCVYGKGKYVTVSDATIRTTMRAHGLVDNKTSGISDRLTATRYQRSKT